jgi:hypothetical protein
MPDERQRQIQRPLQDLVEGIQRTLQKPVYLQVTSDKSGALSIKQIEFLTVDEFAALCKVEKRTVYGWIEDARRTGLKCYRPPGSRGILFEMNEAVEWILNNPNLEND